MLGSCAFFSKTWIEVSGSSAKDVSRWSVQTRGSAERHGVKVTFLLPPTATNTLLRLHPGGKTAEGAADGDERTQRNLNGPWTEQVKSFLQLVCASTPVFSSKTWKLPFMVICHLFLSTNVFCKDPDPLFCAPGTYRLLRPSVGCASEVCQWWLTSSGPSALVLGSCWLLPSFISTLKFLWKNRVN